jgi:hypothetical protein
MLQGASCPHEPEVSRETPKKTFSVMRLALEKDDYSTAYFSLSKSTRQRYQYSHFKMMLEWTIFGILTKSILINWNIKSINYFTETLRASDKEIKIEKAKVLLQHWKYPEYQKEFICVYEDGWRIELTMAGLLGMPQEDEDNLFPSHKKNATTDPNEHRGR